MLKFQQSRGFGVQIDCALGGIGAFGGVKDRLGRRQVRHGAAEQQAREQVQQLSAKQQWPCVFSSSDTTGEKDFEEFFTEDETLDMQRFEQLGIIKNTPLLQADVLQQFEQRIAQLKQAKQWTKADLVSLFHQMLPQFGHKETGRYLDSKM